MSNLQTRILAAMIYFPLLMLTAYDTQIFALAMSLCLGIAWHEYLSFRDFPNSLKEWIKHFSRILLGVMPTLLVALGYSMMLGFAVIAFAFQILVIISLSRRGNLKAVSEEMGFKTLGFVYLTGLFSLLVETQKECGPQPIWFLFLIVGAADSGAYFAGRAFGKSPFFQNISPKKTLEGFMGGVVSGVLAAALFREVFSYYGHPIPSMAGCLVLGFFLSSVSAFGDLFESMLKRHYGVKDSGRLIPGHGGVLDRFDAAMFAAVPLFFYVIVRGGFR
ncbi:MAG: hypothetical protein JWQ35_482 [Bacteriovoracaceae bacterium]|nr:hypothetical protein [Bacteriovoracaceae bacterium]